MTTETVCIYCGAHKANYREMLGGEPCCEGERLRLRQEQVSNPPKQTARDKVISDITEVIYNNTDQNYKGAALIAIGIWERIKDYVEVK